MIDKIPPQTSPDAVAPHYNPSRSTPARLYDLDYIVDEINGTPANVTQSTSDTTGVTANGTSGQITTVALTLAAAGSFSFTVTNSNVESTSLIQLTSVYGGTNGFPVVKITSIGAGSFVIMVLNAGAASLNAALTINYQISNPV